MQTYKVKEHVWSTKINFSEEVKGGGGEWARLCGEHAVKLSI